ncbi:MAG: TRAP transporter TatT component family protein [Acidobacteria bacterium]|nr:TRAP transporter TatT component family protein [Acidobacteriota bacterium]
MSKTSKEMQALADELYAGREDSDSVRRSLEFLQAAGRDYETLWRISRAHFFLGQESQDESERRAHHLSGMDAGGRAARASDEGVEGHFWFGVNLALLAQMEKPFSALRHALGARRELRRAASLNPGYHAAGPWRVLARLESKLPRFLGGGRKRALAHFEEALRLAPLNTVTRLYLAELLQDCGDNARARAELETILATPFDPNWDFEIKRDKTRAREMLKAGVG